LGIIHDYRKSVFDLGDCHLLPLETYHPTEPVKPNHLKEREKEKNMRKEHAELETYRRKERMSLKMILSICLVYKATKTAPVFGAV